MKKELKIILVLLLLYPFISFGQKNTLIQKLDSLSIQSDTFKNGSQNNINPKAYNDSTRLSFHNYFLLLGNDFKQQLTLPFHSKRKDWYKLAEFGAAITAASFADEPVSHYAFNLKTRNNTVNRQANTLRNLEACMKCMH